MPDTSQILRYAVEKAHVCKAKAAGKLTVHEKKDGSTVWYGTVHVFDLIGHKSATRAYAWTLGDFTGGKPQVVTVLHRGKVSGPTEAVRAIMEKLYEAKHQHE